MKAYWEAETIAVERVHIVHDTRPIKHRVREPHVLKPTSYVIKSNFPDRHWPSWSPENTLCTELRILQGLGLRFLAVNLKDLREVNSQHVFRK